MLGQILEDSPSEYIPTGGPLVSKDAVEQQENCDAVLNSQQR